MNEHKSPGPETDGFQEIAGAARGEAAETEHLAEDAAVEARHAAERKAADVRRRAAEATREAEEKVAAARQAGRSQEATQKAAESIRRAAERAELTEANTAAAGERGAAGVPEPVARQGRTLLELFRNQPMLAAAPAAVIAFVVWRALRGR
ncbi:hypothetical protein OHB12_33945 [Nocardia sp. NBC_01730]|uniref:hypothetical protein n=1 Tax=Nocardia sp. NBC_01730 TaxID=2975998 RepID=UPI002E103F2C|nr:hypothetical protein OHB12_33945 [Nocardia sp. NBC_01730]